MSTYLPRLGKGLTLLASQSCPPGRIKQQVAGSGVLEQGTAAFGAAIPNPLHYPTFSISHLSRCKTWLLEPFATIRSAAALPGSQIIVNKIAKRIDPFMRLRR